MCGESTRPARDRWAVAYFAVQGAAVAAWWILLAAWPEARVWFLPLGSPEHDLLAFALPDAALLVGGSWLAAGLAARDNAWAAAVAGLVAGAAGYATLYCLAWSWLADGAWLAPVLMAPCAVLSMTFAFRLGVARLPLLRQARPASPAWNLGKTGVQIVLFWGFFLAVLPLAIAHIERRLGVAEFSFAGHVAVGVAAFGAFSGLGLWSGVTMALRGAGTPLPVDSPRRLVLRGPYARVRNPMAVAGLGQGLAVGVWLGSWGVLLYVALGAAIWNFLVRPAEEADLERHFGAAFVAYRRAVRCWWPRRRPYTG